MKIYLRTVLFLLGILSTGVQKIAANSEGETRLFQVSPSLFNQEKDSVFTRKYQEVQKYYDNEEYSKSLELGLELFTEFEKSTNTSLRYLSGFKLGENFSKINDHDKAILYFKKSLFLFRNEFFLDRSLLSAFKIFCCSGLTGIGLS